TDPGPYFLGSGDTYFSRDAMRRDLEHMLVAARKARIPLLVGSAAGSGADAQLAIVVDIVEELSAQHSLHFRLGVVRRQPPRESRKEAFREGRLRPLGNAPEIDGQVFDRSAHIVAMAGVEPFHAALDGGADVVLSGRCSDAALFAAVPARLGLSPGPVWHAAKI